MDGAGARRQRLQRRIVRYATWILVIVALAGAAMNLPAIDPEYLIRGEGRPILGAAVIQAHANMPKDAAVDKHIELIAKAAADGAEVT
jgi:hypothetical protein